MILGFCEIPLLPPQYLWFPAVYVGRKEFLGGGIEEGVKEGDHWLWARMFC
jgi:hypothetical protein